MVQARFRRRIFRDSGAAKPDSEPGSSGKTGKRKAFCLNIRNPLCYSGSILRNLNKVILTKNRIELYCLHKVTRAGARDVFRFFRIQEKTDGC